MTYDIDSLIEFFIFFYTSSVRIVREIFPGFSLGTETITIQPGAKNLCPLHAIQRRDKAASVPLLRVKTLIQTLIVNQKFTALCFGCEKKTWQNGWVRYFFSITTELSPHCFLESRSYPGSTQTLVLSPRHFPSPCVD